MSSTSYLVGTDNGSKVLNVIYKLEELPIGCILAHKEQMNVDKEGSLATEPLTSNCLLAAAKQVYALIRASEEKSKYTVYYFALSEKPKDRV